jgi:trans-aconitate methyltransferase
MTWNSKLYDTHFSFVPALGEELIAMLAPQAGERILDLGCGTGHLTQKIAAFGASVTGMDGSLEMIEQAKHNYPDLDFSVGRGEDFVVSQPYDAIFSNAALHWMKDAEAVVRQLRAALRPGGRLVAELGGKGNIHHILAAMAGAMSQADIGYPFEPPWYFPSVGEYASLLEKYGFRVIYAAHFDRPTPLEGGEEGLVNWLTMFAGSILKDVPVDAQKSIVQETVNRARPALYQDGSWTADYVRLRIVALVEES